MVEEERPDLISNLPEGILQLIISMIPFKEAIQKIILSTEWRSLMNPLQVNLEFDWIQSTNIESREKIKKSIGSFLKSCENSPQTLKLYLQSTEGNDDKLFGICAKGSHGEFHLDFSVQKKKVPYNFDLILEPEFSSFSSIRKLHLRSVSHFVGNLVVDLFAGCQFLETLSLEKCVGLQNINIRSHYSLKKLVIVDCPNIISITLSAPNLESFSYQGVLSIIQLNYIQHLVDFTLNLRDGLGHNNFESEDVISLISSLRSVEILTISGWFIELLCSAGVIFERLGFLFDKLKELYIIDPKISQKTRNSFACFLNITPFLEKLFVEVDEKSSPVECPFIYQYWHEPHLCMDYATVKCTASQLKYLKFIKLIGFKSESDHILLMDLLLHKAVNLKQMILTSSDRDSWTVAKIPQTQLKFYSKRRYTVISCPNTDVSIVLIDARDEAYKPKVYQCMQY
ncbi:F-box protein At2g39490 isoform X2 [Olea europaea var. sylvestris]|uniref:F-box protein At2g39490 isoform X2 n=1 Tax=Olea europaea var. sylvestris TaxID=158386 RepID=UPI000C1D55FB|nr:F-box protein At2g39490 isoform X2 [Olea europaea var. sylvestris]